MQDNSRKNPLQPRAAEPIGCPQNADIELLLSSNPDTEIGLTSKQDDGRSIWCQMNEQQERLGSALKKWTKDIRAIQAPLPTNVRASGRAVGYCLARKKAQNQRIGWHGKQILDLWKSNLPYKEFEEDVLLGFEEEMKIHLDLEEASVVTDPAASVQFSKFRSKGTSSVKNGSDVGSYSGKSAAAADEERLSCTLDDILSSFDYQPA